MTHICNPKWHGEVRKNVSVVVEKKDAKGIPSRVCACMKTAVWRQALSVSLSTSLSTTSTAAGAASVACMAARFASSGNS